MDEWGGGFGREKAPSRSKKEGTRRGKGSPKHSGGGEGVRKKKERTRKGEKRCRFPAGEVLSKRREKKKPKIEKGKKRMSWSKPIVSNRNQLDVAEWTRAGREKKKRRGDP